MELKLDNLKYLDSRLNGSRPADWDQLRSLHEEEGAEAYSVAEAAPYEDSYQRGLADGFGQPTGETYLAVWVNDDVHAMVINGAPVTATAFAEQLVDAEDEEEAEAIEAFLDLGRRAAAHAVSPDGPMMSYYWPVMEEPDYDADVMAEWAVKLAGLPLCVVYLDGTYGLALTGGGMDLSWQIAEAFVRIGWYPPSTLDLPEGEEMTEQRKVVARAVHVAKQTHADRLLRSAAEHVEKFGV